MSFSKDPDLAMCEMSHRIEQLEKALEHFRDLARVSQWERDQTHINAPSGDEPPASARATVPYKFMTMYVTKE
ncbi:MAG: hypothetical protein WCO62_00255 [Betaproteobacteria bacterium]